MNQKTPDNSVIDVANTTQIELAEWAAMPLDVFEFSKRRTRILTALDTEMEQMRQKLMDLVPSDLIELKKNFLEEEMGQLLQNLVIYGKQQLKIKDPSTDGFGDADNAEVLRLVKELEKAWNNVLRFEITPADPARDNYVSFYIYPLKKKNTEV